MKKYRHLFFDLDRTLWDTDTNSADALEGIYESFGLKPVVGDFVRFKDLFTLHNEALWKDYRDGSVTKNMLRNLRFERVLLDCGVSDTDLANGLNAAFMKISPYKTKLMDGAMELLEYLRKERYHLYIITNGFTRIQHLKMNSSGIMPFFERVYTSENARSNKPNKLIFESSIKSSNALKKESLMIGDDMEADVIGARNFGIDQVYYNPDRKTHNQKITYEIAALAELREIL
jgi:putative hydrolase of the HAD superfamily